MAITAEQLVEQAIKVVEARGKRVVEAGQATEAQATAAREQSEADAANLNEDQEIATLKQLATDYNKETDPT